jgi:hypothetical protein
MDPLFDIVSLLSVSVIASEKENNVYIFLFFLFARAIYRIFLAIYRICLSLKNSSSLEGIRDEFYYVKVLTEKLKSGEVPRFGNGFSKSKRNVLITMTLTLSRAVW